MKKTILTILTLLTFNSNAAVWYYSDDCKAYNYKLSATKDMDDQKYNSRYFYTLMTIQKYNNPGSPHSDYYDVEYDSSLITMCPKGERPCLRPSWDATARAMGVWFDWKAYKPGVKGEHWWRKPGARNAEKRVSETKKCWGKVNDWD